MGFLTAEELKQLLPAEPSAFRSPIPTQSVSSDEFMPAQQRPSQHCKRVHTEGIVSTVSGAQVPASRRLLPCR